MINTAVLAASRTMRKQETKGAIYILPFATTVIVRLVFATRMSFVTLRLISFNPFHAAPSLCILGLLVHLLCEVRSGTVLDVKGLRVDALMTVS